MGPCLVMLQPTSNRSSFRIQPLDCYTGLNNVGYLDVGPRDRLPLEPQSESVIKFWQGSR